MALLPLLMIPQQENPHSYYYPSLFSLTGKETIENIQQHIDVTNLDYQQFQCVGSSHGWLAFSHRYAANPFLFSPFSKTQIYLPPKHTLPTINDQHSKIDKLVVMCGGNDDHSNYTVVIAMHSTCSRTAIAFCRPGDVEWADLGSELDAYDVVCCDATKTAFALGPGPTVEAWDMKGPVPSKKMVISNVSCPAKLHEVFPSDLYRAQGYLALSESGQLFLAMRYVGYFVRPCDGKVVDEGETLTDYASEPLVCPYKTKGFYVFKYDGKEWVEVESLGDEWAMFVGGNETMMVKTGKEVKGNAIYFTDDYWDGMNEDFSYGGHDMGVFNLGDGSFDSVLGCQEQRIVPPPFWISVPDL